MRALFLALGLALLAGAASAQQLLETYVAEISPNDHFNSNGQRLTQPWQIIRQDRANFHRYGAGDAGDEWDSFFASADNRAAAERMIMDGYISPQAARDIVNGNPIVVVEVWGYGDTGTYLNIDVYN